MTPKTKNALKRIERAVRALNESMLDVMEEHPQAMFYLEDNGNFYLLSDESHDARGDARQDRVIKRWDLMNSSGGGW